MNNITIMGTIIISYLIGINLITYLIYALDKYKAKRNLWRIPEKVLIGLAASGGSIGALLAIKTLRHKTLHKKFALGVPAILILQIALALYFYIK